jgi:hypothetical protein
MFLINHPGPWQSFLNRPDNKGLSLMEVKDKYMHEQLLFENYMSFQHQQQLMMAQQSSGGGPSPTAITQPAFDPDAQAFITAAAITDPTQQSAIDALVVGMKADNIWTNMQAIYPFVGGTASQHKYNLKDPRDLDAAYRIQFFGGVTHSSNGVLPNGTNGYADTKFNINPSYLDGHFSTYFRTLGNGWQAGINIILGTDGDTFYGAQSQFLLTSTAASSRYALNINSGPDTTDPDFTDTATSGLYIVNRNAALTKVLKNNVSLTTSNNFDTPYYSNGNFYLLARNKYYPDLGAYEIEYGTRQLAFATIGRGLSDLQSTNLYNRIQAFQTTLGRQV